MRGPTGMSFFEPVAVPHVFDATWDAPNGIRCPQRPSLEQ
jgi:hypothetical protein